MLSLICSFIQFCPFKIINFLTQERNGGDECCYEGEGHRHGGHGPTREEEFIGGFVAPHSVVNSDSQRSDEQHDEHHIVYDAEFSNMQRLSHDLN